MKLSTHPALGDGAIHEQPNQPPAFTLIELAVVVATLAVLAALVLPAMAGVQHKSGRVECASNLRQIGIASMIYAGEYGGWLPPWIDLPGHPLNVINNLSYTRYVVQSAPSAGLVPTNVPSSPFGWEFQNLGYLYDYGLAGNGQMFFCPDQWGTLLGADTYSPLLSTDNGGANPPRVRSSYDFNPRIFTSNNLRRFQKTSDLQPRKLLAVDEVDSGTTPGSFAHARERGWNVLLTDGGVNFSRNSNVYPLLAEVPLIFPGPPTPSFYELSLWDFMEQDH